jgi:hypothetical protein
MIIFLINQTIYNIIMRQLIRKILNEVEEEKQLSKFQKTILGYISENGILETIKMIGNIESFNEIFPDYFSKSSNKIELINELVNANHPDGYIYFYDILGRDVYLGSDDAYDSGDGHTFEEYMIGVGDGSVRLNVFRYDEDGNMYDDAVDDYFLPLKKLSDDLLNLTFESLVDYYL